MTIASSAFSQGSARYYYQLKIYHMTKAQEPVVENFLKTAYLPALKRAGISKVGVFKPVAPTDTTEQLIYVFVPFTSLTQFDKINPVLDKDQQYKAAGKDYLEAAYNKPAYKRIESILLRSFPAMPEPEVPNLTGPKSERVYELRSYESATENYAANKIKQFNEGNQDGNEIKLFKRLNFNTVFASEVISGSRMPNLMYMTTFNNKADRDAHWAAFSADSIWKALSGMTEYQHNVAKNDMKFIYPVDYSDY